MNYEAHIHSELIPDTPLPPPHSPGALPQQTASLLEIRNPFFSMGLSPCKCREQLPPLRNGHSPTVTSPRELHNPLWFSHP